MVRAGGDGAAGGGLREVGGGLHAVCHLIDEGGRIGVLVGFQELGGGDLVLLGDDPASFTLDIKPVVEGEPPRSANFNLAQVDVDANLVGLRRGHRGGAHVGRACAASGGAPITGGRLPL